MAKKILVVDDSKIVRTNITEILKSQGYDTVEAENGKQGFEVWKQNTDVAMILTDVNMPEVGGIEMLKMIYESKPDHNTPMMVLTTESLPHLKDEGKKYGVKAWILKPINNEKFLIVLQKILN